MVGAETRSEGMNERLETRDGICWQFLILAANVSLGAAWLLKGIRVYHARPLSAVEGKRNVYVLEMVYRKQQLKTRECGRQDNCKV